MTIVQHKAAVIARAKQHPILASCGFEGVVQPDPVTKKRPERYWTLFTDSGARHSDRLAGDPVSATLNYWIHAVGHEPLQAQGLADLLLDQLVGWTPTVAGFHPFRIVHVASEPLRMDTEVKNISGEVLHYSVDQLRLVTQKIPA
jgi:hypothetical protein